MVEMFSCDLIIQYGCFILGNRFHIWPALYVMIFLSRRACTVDLLTASVCAQLSLLDDV